MHRWGRCVHCYARLSKSPRPLSTMATLSAASLPSSRSASRAVELLDGGTGEELFRRGMPDDRKIWSAAALVRSEYHDLLAHVHAAYLRAGADYITCNNYGVTPGVGFTEQEIVQYCALAGQLAQRARGDANKPEAKVCGSLPPLLESYRADRIPAFDDGVRLYSVIGGALNPHVDAYLAETLSTLDEAKMALTGVQDYRKPVMVSFTLNTAGRLRSGQCVVDVVQELLHFRTFHTPSVALHAVLFNCSTPESISKALRELKDDEVTGAALNGHDVRLGAYANRLTVIPDDWALSESSAPQAMREELKVGRYVEFVQEWIACGATLIGGCCGIGPEYIERLDTVLREQGVRKVVQ
jgi:S-methylmethionine-dependent homocysteine/selenocysteine methylase